MRIVLSAFLIALIVAGLIVGLLASGPFAKLALDLPDERSLHVAPTPRTGGLGLLAGAAIAWGLSSVSAFHPVVGLAAALAAAFLVDDIRGLPVTARIVLQFGAALFLIVWGPVAPGGLLIALLLVLGTVWAMNLYNFMDGANGIAGGMTVFGFGAYAMAAQAGGEVELAVASTAIVGGALGFLAWNFDPARIFLGDAGSVTLGFLAAAIGLLGWQRAAWPLWFPLLVFSPFVFDATLTLLQRMLRRQTVWRAHNSHYYQRLVRMGWSHRRLALAAYAVMAAAAVSALLLRNASPRSAMVILSTWGLAYAAIAVLIDRRWSEYQGDLRKLTLPR